MGTLSGSGWDYEALAERLAESGTPKPRIYMDCGTEDISLYRANTAFKDKLLTLGFDVTRDIRLGGHGMTFWGNSLRKEAEFLPVDKLELAPDSLRAVQLKRMNDAMLKRCFHNF